MVDHEGVDRVGARAGRGAEVSFDRSDCLHRRRFAPEVIGHDSPAAVSGAEHLTLVDDVSLRELAHDRLEEAEPARLLEAPFEADAARVLRHRVVGEVGARSAVARAPVDAVLVAAAGEGLCDRIDEDRVLAGGRSLEVEGRPDVVDGHSTAVPDEGDDLWLRSGVRVVEEEVIRALRDPVVRPAASERARSRRRVAIERRLRRAPARARSAALERTCAASRGRARRATGASSARLARRPRRARLARRAGPARLARRSCAAPSAALARGSCAAPRRSAGRRRAALSRGAAAPARGRARLPTGRGGAAGTCRAALPRPARPAARCGPRSTVGGRARKGEDGERGAAE